MDEAFLVSIRGVAGASSAATAPEVWSFGTWWKTVSGDAWNPDQGGINSVATLAAESAVTMFSDTNMAFQANVWVTEARVYRYVSDPVTATIIGYSDDTITPQAGAGSFTRTLQDSVAVTLDTSGRSLPRTGRFYLPPQAFGLDANDQISDTSAGHVLDGASDFLGRVDSAFADISLFDFRLIVQSRKGPSYAQKPVVGLRCGKVVDTQRRRRNAIAEAYVERAYP